MTSVLAVWKNNGVYLSTDSQMEEFLARGFDLYIVQDGNKSLLATPKDGFILPKPTIEQRITMNLRGDNNDG